MPEHREKVATAIAAASGYGRSSRIGGKRGVTIGLLIGMQAGPRPFACGRATRPRQHSVNFVTVNLADFAAQSKELESSDFEEIRVKSERARDRRDNVLTTSRGLRLDEFRERAEMRARLR
jgi:hypothetical protein